MCENHAKNYLTPSAILFIIRKKQKGGLFTIYNQMYARRRRLEAEITSIKAQLASLPEGKLICSRNGTRYKWYRSDGHTPVYIPKKQQHLAKQLALKKHLTFLLENLKQEKAALDSFFQYYDPARGETDPILAEHPEVRRLLASYFQPSDQKHFNWMNSSYETNPNYPERKTHKTTSGIWVRSKSEAMIEAVLSENQIPFRYECALGLGDTTVYPDFTILHPHTDSIYYWEHFGLMDNPAYCQRACSKLHLYTSHGIIPTVNLITTYETKEHPLCMDTIKRTVEEYFL